MLAVRKIDGKLLQRSSAESDFGFDAASRCLRVTFRKCSELEAGRTCQGRCLLSETRPPWVASRSDGASACRLFRRPVNIPPHSASRHCGPASAPSTIMDLNDRKKLCRTRGLLRHRNRRVLNRHEVEGIGAEESCDASHDCPLPACGRGCGMELAWGGSDMA